MVKKSLLFLQAEISEIDIVINLLVSHLLMGTQNGCLERSWNMSLRASFQHKIIAGRHVITSEDLPGLQVVGHTEQEVASAFPAVLEAYMRARNGVFRILAVEYERQIA